MHKMNTVKENHRKKTNTRAIQPKIPDGSRNPAIVMDHRTSDSWACARDRAHKRRYEAVCDTQLRQNSIV